MKLTQFDPNAVDFQRLRYVIILTATTPVLLVSKIFSLQNIVLIGAKSLNLEIFTLFEPIHLPTLCLMTFPKIQ